MRAESAAPAPALEAEDRALLTLAQEAIPLVPRPFAALGNKLGLAEEVVIARLTALRESGLVRKIGPVFEPARFGLRSELVAVEVGRRHLAAAGAAIAAWPQVTHCYAREHHVNLWFTALARGAEWFEGTAARVAGLPGVTGTWRLPALRRFKIAVRFDLTAGPDRIGASSSGAAPEGLRPVTTVSPPFPPDRVDLALLAAVEGDLPLCPEPFAALGAARQMDAEGLLRTLREWLADGRVRRYGALVNHWHLGFAANAMTVWAMPEGRMEAVGTRLASSPHVSHCYQRPAFPGFPFNLYAMIHARSREECLGVIRDLSQTCGAGEPIALFSTHEFGKAAPQYAKLLAD